MDDALTNLNWLTFNPSTPVPTSPTSSIPSLPTPSPPLSPDDVFCVPGNFEKPVKQEKPEEPEKPEIDYNTVPVKPPHSYSQLISMALQAFDGRKVLLGEIYDWVRKNFAFFRGSDTSWQNSIRHNLSLNKQFLKIPRDPDDKGKGSYWMLDQSNAQSKDPYCIRRRTFPPENKPTRPKPPQSLQPCVNPIVQSFVNGEKTVEELQAALQRVNKALKSSENTKVPLLKRSKSECDQTQNQTTRKRTGAKRLRKSASESVEATALMETDFDQGNYHNDADNDNGRCSEKIPSFDTLNRRNRSSCESDLDSYDPQLRAGDRLLRFELNWDVYAASTTASSFPNGSCAAALQLSPLQVETSFDTAATAVPAVLSPSSCSTESEHSRIPTPEWWKQSSGASIGIMTRPTGDHLLSPGVSAYTLARVLMDSLTSPCGAHTPLTSPNPPLPHPWSEPVRNFADTVGQINPPPGIFPETPEVEDRSLLLDNVYGGRTLICDVSAL